MCTRINGSILIEHYFNIYSENDVPLHQLS